MARPRTFDEDEAVDRALRLFWERGYEGTSVRDLGAELDLRPGSLYAAFGDKHGLFLRALDHYSEGQVEGLCTLLAGEGPILPRLRALLEGIAEALVAGEQPSGCFMVTATSELVPRDAETTQRAQETFARIDGTLEAALERARAAGEVPAGLDPRAAAGFLTTIMQGLQIAAKADPQHPRVRATVDLALATLTGAPPG